MAVHARGRRIALPLLAMVAAAPFVAHLAFVGSRPTLLDQRGGLRGRHMARGPLGSRIGALHKVNR